MIISQLPGCSRLECCLLDRIKIFYSLVYNHASWSDVKIIGPEWSSPNSQGALDWSVASWIELRFSSLSSITTRPDLTWRSSQKECIYGFTSLHLCSSCVKKKSLFSFSIASLLVRTARTLLVKNWVILFSKISSCNIVRIPGWELWAHHLKIVWYCLLSLA